MRGSGPLRGCFTTVARASRPNKPTGSRPVPPSLCEILKRPLGVIATAAWLAACPLGCVTEYQEGQTPLPPQPREIPSQPSSLAVNRISFRPELYGRDTNGNGRGDRFDATVYLWSEPYPFPLHSDGSLTISLFRVGDYSNPEAEPMREWVFDAEALRAARAKALPGPCYFLQISMLDADHRGGDDIGEGTIDLVARFEQTGRPPIVSGISTVHLDHPGR